MATQGLVTVMSGKKVLMKIVAGCDGDNAFKLADQLRDQWPLNLEEVYALALQMRFGGQDDLVVTDGVSAVFEGETIPVADLGPLYCTMFDAPNFNPRWSQGTADYVALVDV